MLKQLNIKKEYGLIAASVLLLLIAYQVAFKRTIEAWQMHRDLKHQVQQSGDLSVQPGYLGRKNRNLDKIIALYKADNVNFRSNVLSTISSIAEQNNVKLSEVPSQDPVNYTSQYFVQKISFEGDYFALEKTLDRLHSTFQIGMIRSATLKNVGLRNRNDTPQKTVMEVYLEIFVVP